MPKGVTSLLSDGAAKRTDPGVKAPKKAPGSLKKKINDASGLAIVGSSAAAMGAAGAAIAEDFTEGGVSRAARAAKRFAASPAGAVAGYAAWGAGEAMKSAKSNPNGGKLPANAPRIHSGPQRPAGIIRPNAANTRARAAGALLSRMKKK